MRFQTNPAGRPALGACLALVLLLGATAAEALDVSATIAARELLERRAAGIAPVIIDVRTPQEFAADRVPGAVNIPLQEFAARFDEVRPLEDTEVVLYCETGPRAQVVRFGLARLGFSKLRILEGHMSEWRRAGHPFEGSRAVGR